MGSTCGGDRIARWMRLGLLIVLAIVCTSQLKHIQGGAKLFVERIMGLSEKGYMSYLEMEDKWFKSSTFQTALWWIQGVHIIALIATATLFATAFTFHGNLMAFVLGFITFVWTMLIIVDTASLTVVFTTSGLVVAIYLFGIQWMLCQIEDTYDHYWMTYTMRLTLACLSLVHLQFSLVLFAEGLNTGVHMIFQLFASNKSSSSSSSSSNYTSTNEDAYNGNAFWG